MEEMKRVGDKMILVETTITTYDAVVDFQDILDAVEIEPDDFRDAPWENCDGYDHELVRYPDDEDYPEWQRRRGYTWLDGDRRHGLIVLKEECRDVEEIARGWGCSRQVARELAAMDRRRTANTLKDWYANGWEWWYASCEYYEAEASCGGIDSYDYADGEMREELAEEVAHILEKRGFEVVNKPIKRNLKSKGWGPDGQRRQWKRNVCRGNVDEGDTKFNLGSYPGKFGQWYEKIAQKEKV